MRTALLVILASVAIYLLVLRTPPPASYGLPSYAGDAFDPHP